MQDRIYLSPCEYFVLQRTRCDLACSHAVGGAVLLLKAELRKTKHKLKTAVSLRGSKQQRILKQTACALEE